MRTTNEGHPTGRARPMVLIDMRTTNERRVAILERRARVGHFAPRPRSLLRYLEVAELELLDTLADEHEGLAPADHPLVAAMLSAAHARAAGHLVPTLVAEQPLRSTVPATVLPPR